MRSALINIVLDVWHQEEQPAVVSVWSAVCHKHTVCFGHCNEGWHENNHKDEDCRSAGYVVDMWAHAWQQVLARILDFPMIEKLEVLPVRPWKWRCVYWEANLLPCFYSHIIEHYGTAVTIVHSIYSNNKSFSGTSSLSWGLGHLSTGSSIVVFKI